MRCSIPIEKRGPVNLCFFLVRQIARNYATTTVRQHTTTLCYLKKNLNLLCVIIIVHIFQLEPFRLPPVQQVGVDDIAKMYFTITDDDDDVLDSTKSRF